MTRLRIAGTVVALLTLVVFAAHAETKITMAISGPGAVNDTTIKAGEEVSFDVYWENQDDDRRGFTTGFKMTSDDIKNIVHVPSDDTVAAVNEAGDIKAHNGWEGFSAWDFTRIRSVEQDWDGKLPEVIGFGGLRVKKVYNAHENKKVLSWTVVVPTPGTITVDSSFYSPGGVWAIVGPDGIEVPPAWGGPYTFHVVK